MTTTALKEKLHEQIEHSDERLLKMLYAMVKEYEETDVTDPLTSERTLMIEEEREKYLKGEGKSYSWEEVKTMAINKQRPDEL